MDCTAHIRYLFRTANRSGWNMPESELYLESISFSRFIASKAMLFGVASLLMLNNEKIGPLYDIKSMVELGSSLWYCTFC